MSSAGKLQHDLNFFTQTLEVRAQTAAFPPLSGSHGYGEDNVNVAGATNDLYLMDNGRAQVSGLFTCSYFVCRKARNTQPVRPGQHHTLQMCMNTGSLQVIPRS